MEALAAMVAAASVFMLTAYVIRARALRPSESRLRYLSPMNNVAIEEGSDGKALLRRSASSIPAISEILTRRGYARRWSENLERAGLTLRPGEYFLIRSMLALIGVGVVTAIGRSPIAFAGGLIGAALLYMLPAVWLNLRVKGRVSKLNGQLVETISLIANAQRAGFAFAQGVDVAAKRVGPPMSVELNRMLLDTNLGASMDDALIAMNERIGSEDIDMVVTAILIQRQTGGNLAEVLENVTETMRDRERIHGEIKTLTSSQRMTGWILSVWPTLLGLMFFALIPSMMSLLWTTSAGLVLLGVWFVLNALGVITIQKILDIDV